jgi:hypothetical protein
VANLKELFLLYGLVTQTLINVSYLLCQAIDHNARAPNSTPIFFGSIITRLYHEYEIEAQKGMTMEIAPCCMMLSIAAPYT